MLRYQGSSSKQNPPWISWRYPSTRSIIRFKRSPTLAETPQVNSNHIWEAIRWTLFTVNTMLRATSNSYLNMQPPWKFKMVLIAWGPKPISRAIAKNQDKITVRWAICPRSPDQFPNRNLLRCQALRWAIYTSRVNRRAINSIRISRAFLPPECPPKSPTWTSKTWWVSLRGSPIKDITIVIMARRTSRRTETRKVIWYTFREREVPMTKAGLTIPTAHFQARLSSRIWMRQRSRGKFILYLLVQEQITNSRAPVETQRSKSTYPPTWTKLASMATPNSRSKTWKCSRHLQFRKRIRCTCLVREHSPSLPKEAQWKTGARGESKASRGLCRMRDKLPRCTSSNSRYKTASTSKTVWCEWAVITLLSCQAKSALHSNQACRAIGSTISKASHQSAATKRVDKAQDKWEPV